MRLLIAALLLCAGAAAQPVNPPPAILKGSPPGGAGGACSASKLIGYLASTGTIYACPSGTSVWTAVGTGGTTVPILIDSVSAIPVTGVSVSIGYSPKTGNTVIGVCSFTAFSSAVPTGGALSDGGTNTYAVADSYAATGDIASSRFPGYYFFTRQNAQGGNFTYTCTLTPPSGQTYNIALYIMEYSGLSSTLDGTPVHLTTTSATGDIHFGSALTTNATDLIFTIYGLPAGGTNGLCVPMLGSSLVQGSSLVSFSPSGLFTRYVSTTGGRQTACGFPAGTNTWIAGLLALRSL